MNVLTAVIDDRGATAVEGGSISFGRSTTATLKLDVNRSDSSLSRMTGVMQSAEGLWHVVNTASRARIGVIVDGGLNATVAPGAAPLLLPAPCAGRLRIQTMTTYDIDFTLAGKSSSLILPESDSETTTASVADALGLTANEHRFLAALGEPRLRDPSAGAWRVASTVELQDRLGLTAKQIENIINGITIKFSPHIAGLTGTNLGRANTRRHQITDFAIRSGCIAKHDLPRTNDE